MLFRLIVIVCLFPLTGAAQTDTSLQNRLDFTIAKYHQTRGEHSALYNGGRHEGYQFVEGHPYFSGKEWRKGSVTYQGVRYTNIPMLFNLVTEEVVVQYADGFHSISLLPEYVSDFSIDENRFVALSDSSLPTRGIYQKLFEGKMAVLAKRTKFLEENIINQKLYRKFIERNQYYILKDRTYYEVDGEKALLAFFPGRKREVREFLHKNKIRYRKNPEAAIVTVARQFS